MLVPPPVSGPPPTALRLGATRPRLQGRPHLSPRGVWAGSLLTAPWKTPLDGSVMPAIGMSHGTGGPRARGSCRVWPGELFLENLKRTTVSPRGPSSGVQHVPRPPERGTLLLSFVHEDSL